MSNNKTSDIKEIVEKALNSSLKHGAKDARITYSKGTHSSFSVLDNKLDRLHQSTSSSLYIQLYTNNRYGAFSTNQLEGKEVDEFIKRGVEITNLIAEDKDRGLAPKELYFKNDGSYPDLKQYDKNISTIPVEEKKEIAFKVANEIYKTDDRLILVSTEYGDSDEYTYMIDSQGFKGEDIQTNYSISCECSVRGQGDARPEAWWFESSMFFNKLKIEGCGRNALERALSRLNPIKIKSGKYTAVIENRIASKLVSPIISALNGASIQQHNSFLLNKLNQKIFSNKFNLIDRPHEIGLSGSRYYDGDGIATKNMDIIKDGIINTYFITPYFSRKMNIPITIEGPSVLKFDSSNMQGSNIGLDAQKMIKDIGKGIFITGFNGGNCNQATGDFSFGVEGFYFEAGEKKHPIKEMNITGNIISLWNNLTLIGDDPRPESRWQIPTLSFENVDFSGI